MRAEVKSVCVFGADEVPDDLTYFGMNVMVFIGSRDDDRSDAFNAVVCSPRWLAEIP